MLKTVFARFARDEKGASMVEYAVALIVVATIGVTAMNTLGTSAQGKVTCANAVITNTGTC